jgi:hypothetical protein
VACHDTRLAVGYRWAGFQLIPYKWDWGVYLSGSGARYRCEALPGELRLESLGCRREKPSGRYGNRTRGSADLLKPIAPPDNPREGASHTEQDEGPKGPRGADIDLFTKQLPSPDTPRGHFA